MPPGVRPVPNKNPFDAFRVSPLIGTLPNGLPRMPVGGLPPSPIRPTAQPYSSAGSMAPNRNNVNYGSASPINQLAGLDYVNMLQRNKAEQ